MFTATIVSQALDDIYTVESDNYFYMYSSTLAVTDQSNLTNFDPTGNQDYKNS